MKSPFLFFVFSILLSVSAIAADRTSVGSGDYNDPASWDCSCVPASTDNVIIGHTITTSVSHTAVNVDVLGGGKLLTEASFTVLGQVDVSLGGTLCTNASFSIGGNYILKGAHIGNGTLNFTGNSTVFGDGSFTKTGNINVFGDPLTIHEDAELDVSTSLFRLQSNSSVENFGQLTVGGMTGNTSATFKNRGFSSLFVEVFVHNALGFEAHEEGNVVHYIKPTGNQDIKSVPLGYFNLNVEGSSIAASNKRVYGDLKVLNGFRMATCTVDVERLSVISDIEVGGIWLNESADFVERTGRVIFSGNSTMETHLPKEIFFELEFAGNTQLGDVAEATNVIMTNQLDCNGFNLMVTGNWSGSGTVTSNGGEVVFRDAGAADVTGATSFDDTRIAKSGGGVLTISGQMLIYGTLFMDAGTVNTTNTLIIASDENRTGRLAKMGAATFNGPIIVQRYLDFPSNDFRLIGSSVQATTIGEWSGDFFTSGFTGSDLPSYSFVSMGTYDETVSGHRDEGVVDVTSMSDALPTGQGVRAYVSSGETMLTVSGAPVTGNFTWTTLTFTDTGDPENDGWNLVANPYPSTIDWDDNSNWTKSGLNDAIYVAGSEDGTFTSYIAGVGTNGGTQFIPSSQGFWVHANAASPSMTLTEAAKSAVDETFRTTYASSYFTLRMTSANGIKDELAVRSHPAATMDFDNAWDAYEFRSLDEGYPSISLRSEDNKNLSIYSLAEVTEQTMIPMTVYTGVSGDLTFEMIGLGDFPASQCWVYDAVEDRYHEMMTGRDFAFYLAAGEYTDRFFLVIDPVGGDAATGSNSKTMGAAGVDAWLNGQDIEIRVAGEGMTQVDLRIVNAIGQTLHMERGVNLGQNYRVDVSGLEGMLLLQVEDRVSGQTYTERFSR